jgi:pimeloyl-ACP methyl ester carboxylesterase
MNAAPGSWRLRLFRATLRIGGTLFPAPVAKLVNRWIGTPPRRPTSAKEAAVLATARRVPVHTARGCTVMTYRWGDAGPVVLLMHGWGADAGRWHLWVAPLLEAGFQVVAIDGPAHGESSGEMSGLIAFMDGLSGAARDVGEVYAAVGHSLGGAAVLYSMALQPRLPLRRAVILSTYANMIDLFEDQAAYMHMPRRTLNALYREIEKQYDVTVSDYNGLVCAPSVTAETLVVHDRADEVVAFANGEMLAGLIPGARLFATEKLGHHLVLRSREVIAEAVAFLKA